jgi:DnaJ-class molecular chaperone
MNEAPEVYVACDVCGGEGQMEHSRYGGNDPDAWAVPCRVCNGAGGMICEAEGDL